MNENGCCSECVQKLSAMMALCEGIKHALDLLLEQKQKKDQELFSGVLGVSLSTAKTGAITINSWLTALPEGEDAIREDDPLFAWADQIGVKHEWLELAWLRFKSDMMRGRKKKKDWRAHFRNAVRGNWYRLWYFSADGAACLTTQGRQVEAEIKLGLNHA